jgi:thymidylate kinase
VSAPPSGMSGGAPASLASPEPHLIRVPPSGLDPGQSQGSLVFSVFALLEARGVPYCILHGADALPGGVTSDVDCIMPADVVPEKLAAILQQHRSELRGVVVQWLQHEATAHYLVLATEDDRAEPEFLALDVSSDYRRNGRVFYAGEEILASRQRGPDFWVPSPAVEFGCYLVKKIAKGDLADEHGRYLTRLYDRDPAGCDREISRFWRGPAGRLLVDCARSGTWSILAPQLPALRKDLLRPGSPAAVWSRTRYWAGEASRRLRRWRRPTGVHLVLLGPDGAGKSTTLRGLRASLAPAFRRTAAHHLAPYAFRRPPAGQPGTDPHGRIPRGLMSSLAKLVYWAVDYIAGYQLTIRPALARSTLVMFDRYLVDALIDPRRYRYGGPRWALEALWWAIPKPDLVVLLDAPTQVLLGRKQEVPPEEVERQRRAYRALVEKLPNGHAADAAQPLDQVVRAVERLVLDFMAARTAGRLGTASP